MDEARDAAFKAWWGQFREDGIPTDNPRDMASMAFHAAWDAATERAAGVAEERFNYHAGFCPATCKCADGAHIAAAIRGSG